MSSAKFLADYKVEFTAAHDNGLYELGELHLFTDFITREAVMHLNRRFTDVGLNRWLRDDTSIQTAAQVRVDVVWCVVRDLRHFLAQVRPWWYHTDYPPNNASVNHAPLLWSLR